MATVKASVVSVDIWKDTEKSFRVIRKAKLEMTMNTDYVKLTEAARKLAMHPDTIRYWVKLLGVETIKRGHSCYLLAETLGVLVIMARLITEGLTASEAAIRAKVEAPANTTALSVSNSSPSSDELRERIHCLERAILSMAETFKTEITAMRGEVSRLTESNQALQLRLEPPPLPAMFLEPPKPVKPWEPVRVQPQARPWYQQLWFEIFDPEVLRTAAE